MKKFLMSLLISTGMLFIGITAQAYDGKVINAQTKAPIENASVTLGDQVVRTKADGTFTIEGTGDTLKFRTPGYTKHEVATSAATSNMEVPLTPFTVKALYLTPYGLASHKLRDDALAAVAKNKLNALVIDFKGDHGYVPFKINVPMADEIGAQKLFLLKDMPAVMASLKEKNLYLIARIVVFKDDMLAAAKPEWAVRRNGSIFQDREKLRWVDAFIPEVQSYNIALAKAAAEMGFDEVQFDYVRFPDNKGIEFSKPNNIENRSQAITHFLESAYKALAPYNVMVSADIFGYVAWNTGDTGIGQEIDKVTNAVDVVSLMLYPSGFQFGIPDYRNPVQHPYEIVNLTLRQAQKRTNASPLKFRPWLQAFRDYAFKGGDFGEDRMKTQIKASNDFGASGYMFWNPRNVYPTGTFDN